MDQAVTSSVESLNQCIKGGEDGVNPRSNIDTSAKKMKDISRDQLNIKDVKVAISQNMNKSWSDHVTKDYLTDYAEGLAIKLYDRRLKFCHIQDDDDTWYVFPKNWNHVCSYMDQDELDKVNIPLYKRVRKVEICIINDQRYMTCSCGYYQRQGQPCEHMYHVLDYDLPQFHHIRWHQHMLYWYKRDPDITQLHRDMTSKYQVRNGLLLDEVETPTQESYPFRSKDCTEEMEYDTRAILRYMNESGKPVYFGDDTYRTWKEVETLGPDDDTSQYQGMTQVLSQSSQHHQDISASYFAQVESLNQVKRSSIYNQVNSMMKDVCKKVESMSSESQQQFLQVLDETCTSFCRDHHISKKRETGIDTSEYVSSSSRYTNQPPKSKRLKSFYES